ncbi:Uncharacterised protein [uncultured archaeon]|nr:Uncharacterised protein [uncultured archaeon]
MQFTTGEITQIVSDEKEIGELPPHLCGGFTFGGGNKMIYRMGDWVECIILHERFRGKIVHVGEEYYKSIANGLNSFIVEIHDPMIYPYYTRLVFENEIIRKLFDEESMVYMLR